MFFSVEELNSRKLFSGTSSGSVQESLGRKIEPSHQIHHLGCLKTVILMLSLESESLICSSWFPSPSLKEGQGKQGSFGHPPPAACANGVC